MAEKTTEVTRTGERQPVAPDVRRNPFQMLDRLAGEMDHLFDNFGFGRGWFAPRFGLGARRPVEAGIWLPDVEILQRDNTLMIRADLPGLARDDVKVDVTEDAVTIQGERKREHEEEKAGVYRSERSYGSFYRTIALPEGAITDQAKATFKDGVLEVTMPAPPESVKHGRRLEITEASSGKK